jgi:hypothetical protein
MTTGETQSAIPEFVFVCGAVGSGNTFMFSSLTADPHTYGLNEDGLGRTLENLLRPENGPTCPHAVDRYVEFMHGLRHDRRTLVLKTPANIRVATDLRRFLPSSLFIVMIREPHAAVVSGISRHGDRYSIEDIARIWRSDYEHLPEVGGNGLVITFDELASDPVAALSRVAEIMPLAPEVFTYATRVNRPDRSATDRWKSKVDETARREVERWVAELGLTEIYRAAQSRVGVGAKLQLATGPHAADGGRWLTPLSLAKKQFFRAWYWLKRSGPLRDL